MKKFVKYAPSLLVVAFLAALVAIALIAELTDVESERLELCATVAFSGAILSGFFAILTRDLLENDK